MNTMDITVPPEQAVRAGWTLLRLGIVGVVRKWLRRPGGSVTASMRWG